MSKIGKRLPPERVAELRKPSRVSAQARHVVSELLGHIDAVETELAEAMSALDKAATANGQMFLESDRYRKRAEAALSSAKELAAENDRLKASIDRLEGKP
jgi:hypothetical protein